MAAGSLATTREVLDRIGRDLDQTLNPRPSPYQQAPGATLRNVNLWNRAAGIVMEAEPANTLILAAIP